MALEGAYLQPLFILDSVLPASPFFIAFIAGSGKVPAMVRLGVISLFCGLFSLKVDLDFANMQHGSFVFPFLVNSLLIFRVIWIALTVFDWRNVCAL